MHGAVAVDVRDGLVLVGNDLDAHLERQVLAAPVVLGGGQEILALDQLGTRSRLARRGIAMDHDAVPVQHVDGKRQERIGDGAVDEQRLGGVAHAHALGLGVDDDVERLLEIGGLMDVDMAVAGAGLDNGNERLAHAALDEPRTAAGDQQVDDTAEFHEGAGGLAVGRLDHRDGRAGKPAVLDGVGQKLSDHRARMIGERTAAQDAGVTGTDADAGGVGRHVGASLVHHGDESQGHAHLGEVEPAVDRAVVEHTAHGVGQVSQGLKPLGHTLDTLGREQQPVEQACGRTGVTRSRHIKLVRGDDGIAAVAKRGGHGAHGGLALLIARRTERTRGVLGGDGEIVDIHGYIDRHDGPFSRSLVHSSRFTRGGRAPAVELGEP